MDEGLVGMLEELRGKINKPIILNSAWRCNAHNHAVGGVPGSAHTKGQAVDIRISGADAYVMLDYAFEVGFSGIGIKQHGNHNQRFIHLDNMDGNKRPRVWSYK